MRSDAYDLTLRNGSLVFDGHGHGHGVGLCQAGATQMATEGHSAHEILAFYFPGTAVRITPADTGWQPSRVGNIAVRANHALSPGQASAIAQAWMEAQHRFPPRQPILPQITLAPTTELFRQLTQQPGWALASTRDDRIVLQPEDILRRNHSSLPALLQHEFLHVLVESECIAQTPLWLREGLVEELSDEPIGATPTASPAAMDTALQHADSLQAAGRAHHQAAARVRKLVQRYGLSTVRGWLSAGVPTGLD